MEPVVGLDVSKGTSVAQAFISRNEAAGKLKSITHTEEGFEEIGEWLGELRQKTRKRLIVKYRRVFLWVILRKIVLVTGASSAYSINGTPLSIDLTNANSSEKVSTSASTVHGCVWCYESLRLIIY